ncbi:MAG: hypothetical protein ACKO1F_04715 [Flammeovirgaceae bacterium]
MLLKSTVQKGRLEILDQIEAVLFKKQGLGLILLMMLRNEVIDLLLP